MKKGARKMADESKNKQQLETIKDFFNNPPKVTYKGKIKLNKPLQAGENEITELKYDFEKITGLDYAMALSFDKSSDGIQDLSVKQMVALFASGLETEGLDATDLLKRLDLQDMMAVVQVIRLFFTRKMYRASISIVSQ